MRAIFIVLLLAAPVVAEPVQIAEIYGRLVTFFPNVDPPTTATFRVEGWEVVTTSADLGHTFTASPEQLAAFDAAWKRDNAQFDQEIAAFNDDGQGASDGLEPAWTQIFAGYNVGGGAHTAQAFVPQLGEGINGYRLTSVEQTIERWFAVRSPSQTSEFAHRIRIFGEVIPEPATIVLVLMAVHVMGLTVRRR